MARDMRNQSQIGAGKPKIPCKARSPKPFRAHLYVIQAVKELSHLDEVHQAHFQLPFAIHPAQELLRVHIHSEPQATQALRAKKRLWKWRMDQDGPRN